MSSRATENLLNAIIWNDEIDKRIYLDFLRAKKEINLLLIGAGGAEWSVWRQLRLPPGLTDRERSTYKEAIFSNIAQDMRAILEAMPALDISLSSINEARRAIILSRPELDKADVLPPDVANAIRGLSRDPGVKGAVSRGNEFGLSESAVYYFNSIDRIEAVGYVPSDQDILRCRVKAEGVAETSFQVGELTYKIFHPHDQRSNRKKWIHCFENVNAILFCVDLTQYDQMLYEDESVNCIQEAIILFDSICNSRWFVKTSMLLFLNIDGLMDKLQRSPLADYFPDYTGGDNFDAVCDYFLHRFVSLNQSAATKQIYAQYTSTMDSQHVKFLLSSIRDILFQLRLHEQLGSRSWAWKSRSSRTSLQSWIAALKARYSGRGLKL
ncbi:heterotrimeric G protein alpha subunit B [Mycena albidolilacea]|uniref:Heterotrimeric G protein alpha subunit B n=1 Tax=Mycena albidolilacea TaxID=1033008 RepID=A0AAD7E7V6_9AGAR|nr:heterotrimeric G protein alpha subunit B [Mycena albidolilacea]